VESGKFKNIILRNITINKPVGSTGVIIGSSKLPMENIIFDHVIVTNPPIWPSVGYYTCSGVSSGIAINGTSPVPSCFKR